jgi:WD40 repeat protein
VGEQRDPANLQWPSWRLDGLTFSPDGRRLATLVNPITIGVGPRGLVKVWDVARGAEVCQFQAPAKSMSQVAFHPEGKILATAGADHTVRLWDAASGAELRVLHGHTDEVTCLAFSGDGKRLASGGKDRTIRLWEVETGQSFLTLRGHMKAVRTLLFSPDGHRLASAAHDYTVKIWDGSPWRPRPSTIVFANDRVVKKFGK